MSLLVGKLRRFVLREVWKDEAHNFIPGFENDIERASLVLMELHFCLLQHAGRDCHDATA